VKKPMDKREPYECAWCGKYYMNVKDHNGPCPKKPKGASKKK